MSEESNKEPPKRFSNYIQKSTKSLKNLSIKSNY